eukprot:jgi/Picsp_1/3221/NSC_06061-R1_d111 g-patch domain-containing protein
MSVRYQGVQKASAGYRLLASMGWKEGEGLGASKQGITEHIKVKKKFENWGVGAVEHNDRTRDWSNGMSEFHRVLSTLSEITSKHACSSSGSEESDLESPRSVKKVSRKEDKKQRKKEEKRKKKKKEKPSSDKKRKISDTSAKNEEPAVERKKTSHIGRFKKRETSKMVKGYSTCDLAAILGEDPFAAKQQPIAPVEIEQSQNDRQSLAVVPMSSESLEIIRDDEENAIEEITSLQDQEASWWSDYFVKGSKSGSGKPKSSSRSLQKGFSEQDQENLFTSTHDGATQGRVGLGRSSMPTKVGGVRWAGTKKKLDSDSEDECAVDEDTKEMNKEDDGCIEDDTITVMLPKSKKPAPLPWEDILLNILRENQSMRIKALVKITLKELKKTSLGEDEKVELKSSITEYIKNGSTMFSVKGKTVTLSL